MISRKLMHQVMNRLQLIMSLNDVAEVSQDGWHFYDSKTGEEIKEKQRAHAHLRLKVEVHAIAELMKRHMLDEEVRKKKS